jgi:hypothetical protein
VFAQSHARVHKERAMRQRKLKWLWARLKEIAQRAKRRLMISEIISSARPLPEYQRDRSAVVAEKSHGMQIRPT